MLAGNIPGKTGTISQKIAMVIQDGDYMTAGVWVAIVLVIAFQVLRSGSLLSRRFLYLTCRVSRGGKRWR